MFAGAHSVITQTATFPLKIPARPHIDFFSNYCFFGRSTNQWETQSAMGDKNEKNSGAGNSDLDPLLSLLSETESTQTKNAGNTSSTGSLTINAAAPSPLTESANSSLRQRRIPKWFKITLAAVTIVMLVPLVSFGKAMATPSNLSLIERGAEWMRDNGMGDVLNSIEGWHLLRNQPEAGGEPDREIGTISTPTTSVDTTAPHLPKPANVAVPFGVTPLENEGVWQQIGPTVGGAATMYTTQVRPDSVRTRLLAGLTWIDPKTASFEQFPGTEEPGGRWNKPSQVPLDRRLDLIAAFNSGFRMQDARGGYYDDGVMHKPLRDGAASFVILADGTASVGVWGRDFTMNPTIRTVRQNLDLIVDNGGGLPAPVSPLSRTTQTGAAPGQLVPGLSDNSDGAWGATFGNKILAWRSAVGVTATGGIVYGYGDGLGALSLADLMLRAGCVRAMELDINTVWTTFNFYQPTTPGDPASVAGTKLLPESFKGANRYLSPDARDFVAVFKRTF